MIIYKIQESGQATDFQFSQKCPVGFKSIDGDRIPENIEQYHEQLYIDSQAIENQKAELLNLIKVNEYHLISRRFSDDVPTWEKKLDEWAAQLAGVQAGKLVEIAEKPVF